MEDSPTTFNGLLHNPEADLGDRRIVAIFDTFAQARTAHERLLKVGIPAERMHLMEHAGEDVNAAATAEPPDQNVIGRIRKAVLPDHATESYRKAVDEGDPMLTVHPLAGEVEEVVEVLQAAHPKRFDPRLERWRNSGEAGAGT
jgi:hypothetical protein